MQTGKALFTKSSSPLPNDLRAHPQAAGDLHVGQALSGHEHELRALHIPIGKRQLGGPPLKRAAFLLTERDFDRRRHRQRDSPLEL
ncbi:MAG: hypothetical protein LC777_05300 [Actinobacteria bacterium]|nr:hypothetical protein [Actinomycetota bacterium]